MADFWDAVREAGVSFEDPSPGVPSSPKFTCTLEHAYGNRSITIYLDEQSTRKAAIRKFVDGLSSNMSKDLRPLVERIVDDLFDRFGASGILEYDPKEAERCNLDWAIRMLRRDLKRRGLPTTLTREQVEYVLDELYVIEPVLSA